MKKLLLSLAFMPLMSFASNGFVDYPSNYISPALTGVNPQVAEIDSLFNEDGKFLGFSVIFNDGVEYGYETKSLSKFTRKSSSYLDLIYCNVLKYYMKELFIPSLKS